MYMQKVILCCLRLNLDSELLQFLLVGWVSTDNLHNFVDLCFGYFHTEPPKNLLIFLHKYNKEINQLSSLISINPSSLAKSTNLFTLSTLAFCGTSNASGIVL
jgi:hypothetical protein